MCNTVGMRKWLALSLALTAVSTAAVGCTQEAASTAPAASTRASGFPLGLPRAPVEAATPPTAIRDEEPLPVDLHAPLVLPDAPVPDATEGVTARGGFVYSPPPAPPQAIDHVCPSGTAPYAEVTESRAEPAPGYGESPESYGHRYLVTAAGRVRNGTTGDVSLDFSRPITVTVDGRGTRLDDVRVARQLPARSSHSWTASGYYTHYGDASYWRPRLSAVVDRWTWADHRDRNCPR